MKYLNVVVKDLAVGNDFAALMERDTGGQIFGRQSRTKLRAIGDQTNTEVAWCTETLVSDQRAALIVEFNSAGPYPTLNAAGKTDAQIAVAKSKITAVVGEYSVVRGGILALIAQMGFEVF